MWVEGLIGAIILYVISYYVIYVSIEKFIYDKVKIIYKNIHRFKGRTTSKSRQVRMNENVFDKVNQDVELWAEDSIKEIRMLRETDTFRREFIGNLSHELKTPIFNIQGYILTLLEGALEDPEINKKFLKKAAKGVERITNLLEDLDEITRVEAGKITLKKERFNIVELCREVIESLEHKAKKKNITLRLKNVNEPAIMVLADRSKINQVLTNLMVNSINYGNQDGETKVRFYDMDDNILIEVADNGIGMESHHLPRVFERFYRVDRSRSRDEGGSGLGLSIVKHMVEAHNQSINVRSTPDVGSTFSFTLEKA